MLAVFGEASARLRSVVETVTWALAALLVLVVTVNVFARYVLEIGIPWTEEVSRLAFVWLVFLGAYVALCRKGHMAITVLIARLPARHQVAMLSISRLLVLAFLASIAWAGIELVRMTIQFGRVSPILGISAAWGYVAVPVAAILMFIETLREFVCLDPLPRPEGEDASAPAEPA